MITSSYFKAPTWGRSRPRPQIRPPRLFEVLTKVNLEGLTSDTTSEVTPDQNFKSVDFKGRLFLYASRVYYSSHWGRLRPWPPFRPHWYDSYLLHSKFQSWQMRSLPTLDPLVFFDENCFRLHVTKHPIVNIRFQGENGFWISLTFQSSNSIFKNKD